VCNPVLSNLNTTKLHLQEIFFYFMMQCIYIKIYTGSKKTGIIDALIKISKFLFCSDFGHKKYKMVYKYSKKYFWIVKKNPQNKIKKKMLKKCQPIFAFLF